jgi:hypothetical protein
MGVFLFVVLGQIRVSEVKKLLLAAAFATMSLPAHAANIRVTHACCNPIASDLVWLKGEIDKSDYEKFYNATMAIPPGKAMVILDSPGGNVLAGVAIGGLIHANSYTTIVDNGAVCVSMCSAIWLAGKRRFIEAGAFLGFHSTSIAGTRSESGNQVMREYYHNIGLRSDAIDVLLSYDPRTVNWLSVELSRVLGITYEIWHPPGGLSGGEIGRGYHWGEPPPPADAMPMRPDR